LLLRLRGWNHNGRDGGIQDETGPKRDGISCPGAPRRDGDRLPRGRWASPTGPGGANQGWEGVRWDGQGHTAARRDRPHEVLPSLNFSPRPAPPSPEAKGQGRTRFPCLRRGFGRQAPPAVPQSLLTRPGVKRQFQSFQCVWRIKPKAGLRADVGWLSARRGTGFAGRAGSPHGPSERGAPGSVPATVPLPLPQRRTLPATRCLVPPTP